MKSPFLKSLPPPLPNNNTTKGHPYLMFEPTRPKYKRNAMRANDIEIWSNLKIPFLDFTLTYCTLLWTDSEFPKFPLTLRNKKENVPDIFQTCGIPMKGLSESKHLTQKSCNGIKISITLPCFIVSTMIKAVQLFQTRPWCLKQNHVK